jgi:uncharacterized protein YjbI with pentapeptide repeats
MAGQVNVDWLTCDEDECIGIRLDAGEKCLAHARDEERDDALRQVAQTGKIDGRGVTISSTLLKKILDSTPRNPNGRAMLTNIRFGGATFQGDARFSETTFQGIAEFGKTTFQGIAEFGKTTFQGTAEFGGAAFQDTAQFIEATFQSYAHFDGAAFRSGADFGEATFKTDARFRATFQGDAGFREATFYNAWFGGVAFQSNARFILATFGGETGFDRATFRGRAWFDKATFGGEARFSKTTFQGTAEFIEAAFQGRAEFGGATFQAGAGFARARFRGDAGFREATFHNAWFGGATFHRAANFFGATFERAQRFGPVLAHRGLNLDVVQFAQPVRIEASTIGLCCRRARFPGGVQFRLRWADVVLDDTDIPAPSLLTGIPRLASEKLALAEQQIARDWEQEHGGHISEQPRLLSLQRANVAGLGLANVDLAGCRFSAAHNLDKLRLEADVAFMRVGWEQRQVVAEECAWRAGQTRSGRWADPWWPDRADPWWPEDLEKPMALAPGAIAGLYRALRKSREDAKDEPGAADFYYGEMEMRRHAHRRADRGNGGSRGRVDRSVLTAYWLVSGYGLRAWRALAWLAGITLAFAFAFHLVGFTRPPQPATYWTSLLYAFRSTISLTDNEVALTAWGQLLQALLRLTGPVLLGLALLALRNRVKR